jgi:hypothetical protein
MKELLATGTMLAEFVHKKLKGYVGPKKGQGHKGGPFTVNKFVISLMLLTSTPRKRIVKGLTTEQVLKNWMMDEDFSGLVQDHIKEFSKFWVDSVLDEERRLMKEKKGYEQGFQFMTRLDQEGKFYDLATWTGIYRELKERAKVEPMLYPYLLFALRFKSTLIARDMKGRRDQADLLKEIDVIDKEASANSLAAVLEVLEKPEITPEDREFLVWRFRKEYELVKEQLGEHRQAV